jgi:hypothetical protein
MVKVTWHNVLLDGPVWALRRGHWREATVFGRGRFGCRVRIRRYRQVCTTPIRTFGGILALSHARTRPTSHGGEWFFTQVCPQTFSKWESTGTAR